MLQEAESSPNPIRDREQAILAEDPRWHLVQRILASAGFQRAEQLRKILAYVATSAILRPDEAVREYQLACEVLGRRSDFDPVSDNIVRAQMSHLRRKLETYYQEEGRAESLRLVIPRGSYHPHFMDAPLPLLPPSSDKASLPVAHPDAEIQLPARGTRPYFAKPWTQRESFLAVFVACLLILVASLSWKLLQNSTSRSTPPPNGNAFIRFLNKSTGNVTVVLPDTSFMLLQQMLHTNLSAKDYARGDYFVREIEAIKDPLLHDFLSQLRIKRNTSIGEAIVATDLLHAFSMGGVQSSIRYARDLRVRDLNEGNTILIGSHRSNPWNSLFSERMNFRFYQDPGDQVKGFHNSHPLPGEEAFYVPYLVQDGKMSSYVNVALTQNSTSSGYVMLFDGSDSPAIEAAAHFLLHGTLPVAIDQVLRHDDLTYFEIFLRGTHADADAEETFDVVGIRSASK